MIEKKSLSDLIKKRINELITQKKTKKSHLSLILSNSKNFISTVLGDPSKSFNLDHIEKICAALDYPVSQLFTGEKDLSPKTQNLIEQGLLETFKELSFEGQIYIAQEAIKRKKEEEQRGSGKKAYAVPGENGSRGGQNVG